MDIDDEIERLKAALDEVLATKDKVLSQCAFELVELEKERDEAQAKCAEMRETLRPTIGLLDRILSLAANSGLKEIAAERYRLAKLVEYGRAHETPN